LTPWPGRRPNPARACAIRSAHSSRFFAQRNQSARRARSLEGVFDGEALPDVACMNHEIAFGRGRKEEHLPVGHRHWKYTGGRHNKAHFIADGNPVLCIDSGGSIATRCAKGEVDGEDGGKNERMRKDAAIAFMS
jgi:hypothetical protein